jgi:hypothetical protein
MSDEKELQEETVETVEQANEKTPFNMEEFYENNKKAVSIGAGVVALLVLRCGVCICQMAPGANP